LALSVAGSLPRGQRKGLPVAPVGDAAPDLRGLLVGEPEVDVASTFGPSLQILALDEFGARRPTIGSRSLPAMIARKRASSSVTTASRPQTGVCQARLRRLLVARSGRRKEERMALLSVVETGPDSGDR
jgi:hypothetical protein